MTELKLQADRLVDQIEWQQIPGNMCFDDIEALLVQSIKDLYIMTGRALMFREEWLTRDEEMNLVFFQDLMLDEQEYVLLTALISFYQKVQSAVNGLVSYTTDAMAIAHADKPYANLQQTINDLKLEQRKMFYKMERYLWQ